MELHFRQHKSNAKKMATSLNPNPFSLPPVVERLMLHLTARELLTCRLVSREWFLQASARLRQVKTLKFRLGTGSLASFTAIMEHSSNSPYSNFELEFFDMEDPVLDQFLQVCGPYMISLQLNNCRSSRRRLRLMLNQLRSTLVKFSINCDPIGDDEDAFESGCQPYHLPYLDSLCLLGEHSRNDGLIRDLISAGSNLSSLHFKCYDPLAQKSDFEIRCLQIFLEPYIHLPCLRQFQMESQISDSELFEVSRKKCMRNVKDLRLSLANDVKPSTLVHLLESLPALTKLGLEFSRNGFESSDDGLSDSFRKRSRQFENGRREDGCIFPKQMTHLERLSLTNFSGSLAFVSRCQCLKYLVLLDCDDALPTLSLLNVKHLSLLCFVSSTLLDTRTCSLLAKTFPNLRTLKVVVDDDVMDILLASMTSLHELILSGQKLTDRGIIGSSEFNYFHKHDSENSSIGNLKDLRKLWIHNAGYISDASVLHGITFCPKLNEISLLNAEVTDLSLIAIGRELPNLKKLEILSNIPQLSPVGKAYIRQQLPNCDFILGQMDIMNLYRPQRFSYTSASTSSRL